MPDRRRIARLTNVPEKFLPSESFTEAFRSLEVDEKEEVLRFINNYNKALDALIDLRKLGVVLP